MINRRKFRFLYALLITVLALGAFVTPSAQAAPKGNTIVDVALAANAESGEFSILIAALRAADPAVIQTLSGRGQFTVFAPTDAAFVSLLGELGLTADQLLSNKALVTQVLLYHVARGNRDSAEVLASGHWRAISYIMVEACLPTRTDAHLTSLRWISGLVTV